MPFHNAYKQKGGNYKIKVKITVFLVPANCCQWSWRISNRQLARALDDSRALIAEKLILRSYRFIKLLPGAEYLARFLRIRAAVRRICFVTGPSRASVNSGYGGFGENLRMACQAASVGYTRAGTVCVGADAPLC